MRSSRDYCLWIITYFRSTAVLGFACASFRRLRLVLWLFTSCVWDVLWYRILIKTAFFLEQSRNFPKRLWVRSKKIFLGFAGLVSLIVTKKSVLNFLRSLYLEQYVFFVQKQSRVWAALNIRGYVWYFGFFTSCVWHLIPCQIKNSSFSGNVVFVVLEVYNRFDGFRRNLLKRLADAIKTKTQTF